MENSAAHRHASAMVLFPPKSTICEMVLATLALKCVMMSTPRKLNAALMRMAARAGMQRVVTQVAMALGASVHPLTKMAPSARITVTARTGFDTSWPRKVENVTSIYGLSRSLQKRYKNMINRITSCGFLYRVLMGEVNFWVLKLNVSPVDLRCSFC